MTREIDVLLKVKDVDDILIGKAIKCLFITDMDGHKSMRVVIDPIPGVEVVVKGSQCF